MITPTESPKRGNYEFSTVFKATKSYIDYHNKTHFQITSRLNAGHRATAELIVRLYAKQLNHAIALGESMKDLPGFKTFNSSLATCKGCTKRTIMNHKERLKAAGFITKELHCGKSGIQLWINPLVFASINNINKPINSPFSESKIPIDLGLIVKNLHPLVHVHQEQNNNNSNVNKLRTTKKGMSLLAQEQNKNFVTRTEQDQDMNMRKSTISNSELQTKKNKKNARPQNSIPIRTTKDISMRKSTTPDANVYNDMEHASAQASESAFLLQLVKSFWSYARLMLFKSKILSPAEEIEILNHIWVSVYKKFNVSGDRSDWINHQNLLYKRIDMVVKYLERDPKRWVAPPHLYFDPENTRNGFDKTYQWFLKQELLKTSIRNQILIQTTEKEWKEHDKGKGRHQHKTRLQLFRIQQQRLGTYCDEQLMRDYENSLQHNVLKFSL